MATPDHSGLIHVFVCVHGQTALYAKRCVYMMVSVKKQLRTVAAALQILKHKAFLPNPDTQDMSAHNACDMLDPASRDEIFKLISMLGSNRRPRIQRAAVYEKAFQEAALPPPEKFQRKARTHVSRVVVEPQPVILHPVHLSQVQPIESSYNDILMKLMDIPITFNVVTEDNAGLKDHTG
jgi:hypothetical protein